MPPPSSDADEDAPALDERYERWEERLAWPVLIAALASVPAVFLTLLDGAAETTGRVINGVSGAVLVAETVVLGLLSRDKRAWVREHKWLLLLTALIVPAVVLAVGPVQLLRLLRVVGALRLVRARRIFRAASVLRERAGLTGVTSKAITFGAALLVALFVGVVLADPSSQSRQLAERALERAGGTWLFVAAVVLAGLLLGGATWVVSRSNRDVSRGSPRS
jgi:CsoR family transcriptional regulator, copper-sensing transcriptional repressor